MGDSFVADADSLFVPDDPSVTDSPFVVDGPFVMDGPFVPDDPLIAASPFLVGVPLEVGGSFEALAGREPPRVGSDPWVAVIAGLDDGGGALLWGEAAKTQEPKMGPGRGAKKSKSPREKSSPPNEHPGH